MKKGEQRQHQSSLEVSASSVLGLNKLQACVRVLTCQAQLPCTKPTGASVSDCVMLKGKKGLSIRASQSNHTI